MPISVSIYNVLGAVFQFATSAKRIQNKATVNEIMTEAAMLQQYRIQLKKLQQEINTVSGNLWHQLLVPVSLYHTLFTDMAEAMHTDFYHRSN